MSKNFIKHNDPFNMQLMAKAKQLLNPQKLQTGSERTKKQITKHSYKPTQQTPPQKTKPKNKKRKRKYRTQPKRKSYLIFIYIHKVYSPREQEKENHGKPIEV